MPAINSRHIEKLQLQNEKVFNTVPGCMTINNPFEKFVCVIPKRKKYEQF